MDKEKRPEEMTIGEFLAWFNEQYEASTNPTNFLECVAFLEGLKTSYTETSWLDRCISVLRSAHAFFDVAGRHTRH